MVVNGTPSHSPGVSVAIYAVISAGIREMKTAIANAEMHERTYNICCQFLKPIKRVNNKKVHRLKSVSLE